MVCLPLLVGDRAIGAATHVVPRAPRLRRRRARLLQRDGGHLRAGARPRAGAGRRRPTSRPSWRSSPTPPRSWRAASTTRRRSPTSRASPYPRSRTGARSRSASTASSAPSRSPTSIPRRWRWRRSSRTATRPTPTRRAGRYQVFRSGQSELTPEITDEMLDASDLDPEQVALIRELNLRSAMAVPLVANGRVLGVITWVAGDQGRRFGETDLAFARGPRPPRGGRDRQRPAPHRAARDGDPAAARGAAGRPPAGAGLGGRGALLPRRATSTPVVTSTT